MSDIRIIATNANVAFHTISVTSTTSLKSTTPTNRARIAPPIADHPIDNPFGCQITNTKVIKKISDASKIDDGKFYSPNQDQKSTRLNSSHFSISYSFFCL